MKAHTEWDNYTDYQIWLAERNVNKQVVLIKNYQEEESLRAAKSVYQKTKNNFSFTLVPSRCLGLRLLPRMAKARDDERCC